MVTEIAPDRLAASFESLGDNCEFGIVQRACGAEPLGLLRFSGAQMKNLLDVIASKAERLFTAEDLNIYLHEGHDEYLCASRYYDDFHYHTLIAASSIPLESFRTRHLEVLAFLKKKFFDDLARAEKIYVRKGADSITDIRKLHRALNAYGPNALLCVCEADAFHEPGTVDAIEDDLWRAYLPRFKRFNKEEPVDLANWLRILATVHRKRQRSSGLARPRPINKGDKWVLTEGLAKVVSSRRDARSGFETVQVELLADASPNDVLAFADISCEGLTDTILVFSVEIEVGVDFRGDRIEADVAEGTVLHRHLADMNARQGRQRMWVVARSSSDNRRCTLAIKVRMCVGGKLTLGGWTVETGAVPTASRRSSALTESRGWSRRLRGFWHRRSLRRSTADRLPKVVRDASKAMARGAFIEADDRLATALTAQPENVELLKLYALSAHNSGRYVAAIERWRNARRVSPHDPMCLAGVAANFREFGEVNFAASEIQAALELFPADGIVLTEAARIAHAQGQWQRALALWNKAITLHGSSPELLAARQRSQTEIESEVFRA